MSSFSDLGEPARSEFWALLALRHAYGIGPLRAKRLWDAYGSGLAAAEACLKTPASWAERALIPLPTARKFASGQWREQATLEWAAARASGISFLCINDPAYPALLRELPDAPLVLYYRGDVSLLRGPCVGVVGARDCTHEGIAVSAFFARDLSKAGVTVISGLARGIDRAAHLAGLEGPGSSIGVLGTGVDVIYPACNADLHALLAEKGLLISEFAPGTPANAKHFPVRNRLISGLARGVLVVEAAGRSGSLITARLALEQNRDVFAVPGHTMAAVSGGCRELIRRGAKAVFNADDILGELTPLLALDVRADLDKRSAEAAAKKTSQARNRNDESFADAMADALSVLPPGGLPWTAPAGQGKKPAPRRAPCKRDPALSPIAAASVSRSVSMPAPQSAASPAAVAPPSPSLSAEESLVLGALSARPAHIDEIARKAGMDVARLSGLLTVMEIRGMLRHMPGMLYALPEQAE